MSVSRLKSDCELVTAIPSLQAIESEYHWTIGSTALGRFNCTIWERGRWRDRNRIVVNGCGNTFDEAIHAALKALETRGPVLRNLANHGEER